MFWTDSNGEFVQAGEQIEFRNDDSYNVCNQCGTSTKLCALHEVAISIIGDYDDASRYRTITESGDKGWQITAEATN